MRAGESSHQQSTKIRRTSVALEKAFSARPSVEDLKIGSSTVSTQISSRLATVATKLERRMSIDNLSHLLESRPSIEEVAEIAPSLAASIARIEIQGLPTCRAMHVASSLQTRRKSLEMAMTRDTVGHLLESRPSFGELVDMNVIRGDRYINGVADPLVQQRAEVERKLKQQHLESAIRRRPSVQDMSDMGLLSYGHLGNLAPSDERVLNDFDYDVDDGDDFDEDDDEIEDAEHWGRTQQNDKIKMEYRSTKNEGSIRRKAALALRATSRLYQSDTITLEERYALKDLIVSGDLRVLAAAEVCEEDRDISDFLDTMHRIVKAAARI